MQETGGSIPGPVILHVVEQPSPYTTTIELCALRVWKAQLLSPRVAVTESMHPRASAHNKSFHCNDSLCTTQLENSSRCLAGEKPTQQQTQNSQKYINKITLNNILIITNTLILLAGNISQCRIAKSIALVQKINWIFSS